MTITRPKQVSGRERGWTTWLAIALITLTFAAYVPATRCAYIWDDDAYVESNSTLRSVEGLGQIWFKPGATPQYYPMVFTTYWLEYRAWGLGPAGYHVVNVLLHAISAVLLWRILRLLEVPGAWVAAAVFALHPVHVESVAWITERKNVLSGVFYLGAALAYLRGTRWFHYALSLSLFVLALLSKTVTCSLPAALLLVLWWKRGRILRSDLVALAPFFGLGIAFAAVTVWMERTFVGASGEGFGLSAVERCLLAGRALWFYASKLLLPIDLAFIYPRWEIDARALWPYVFPLAAVATIAALWVARRRIGTGPLVAVLIFAGTLVPALGFIDVYPFRFSFVADHFQYHASIALIALAVAIIARGLQRLDARRVNTTIALATVALVALGGLTFRQTFAYHDAESLWSDTLRKNPDAWIAHNNLAVILGSRGDHEGLVRHLERAIAINPDYPEARVNLALGLSALGRSDEAALHMRHAIEIVPDKPEALMNTAWMLATHADPKLRDPAEAVPLAERAVELTQRRNPAHLDVLAAAYASAGRFDDAVKAAKEAQALAESLRKDAFAMDIARRLMLYQRRIPFRQGMALPR